MAKNVFPEHATTHCPVHQASNESYLLSRNAVDWENSVKSLIQRRNSDIPSWASIIKPCLYTLLDLQTIAKCCHLLDKTFDKTRLKTKQLEKRNLNTDAIKLKVYCLDVG